MLLSDGVGAQEAQRAGVLWDSQSQHRLSVLAVGTTEGGPIPLRAGGFLKDKDGSIVIARLSEPGLRELAARGRGVYTTLDANDADIDAVTRWLQSSLSMDDARHADVTADVWRELGPWLILMALPLVSLAFRRGLLWALPMSLLFTVPEASAFDWRDIWRNQDQYAGKLFEQGEYAEAARLFNDNDWAGAAYYRSGDYESALERWSQNDDETAHYNRGNALAKLGRYQEAIEAYDEVLRRNPDHADARFSKEQVESWVQNQSRQSSAESQSESQNETRADNASQSETSAQSQSQASSRNGDSHGDSAHSDLAQHRENNEQALSAQQAGDEDDASAADALAESSIEPDTESLAGEEAVQREQQANLEKQMSEQAATQWLRKIPDDPGGLLRRKFRYQYRQRGGVDQEAQAW